jgi:ComF family protein
MRSAKWWIIIFKRAVSPYWRTFYAVTRTSKRKSDIQDFLLDIVFPNRCPCCDSFIAWNDCVCALCSDKLETELWQTADYAVPDNCEDVFAAYRYEGTAVEGLYALKFADGRNFAKLSAQITAERIEKSGVNAVVAVPMGKERIKHRGYNQADVFADYIAKITGLPIIGKVLFRQSETEQHKLTAENRYKNAGKAYGICENAPDISGMNILLADDVETTGATLTACADLLKQAGAAAVYGAVCVKTVKHIL